MKSRQKGESVKEIEWLREFCSRNYKLFYVDEKRTKEVRDIGDRQFYYLGSMDKTGGRGEPTQKLKEKNYFVRKKGGMIDTGKTWRYYIAKKPKRQIRIFLLSKKELVEVVKQGRDRFERVHHVKLVEDIYWTFEAIRSDGKVIFIKKDYPLIGVSINDLKDIGSEARSGGGANYYYAYNGKKYFQSTRYDRHWDIHTRDGTKIYEYKYRSELKKEAKERGLKKEIKGREIYRNLKKG